jgi:hypothetical protein
VIVVETAIDIARPSAEVFDFVADQTNAPRWQRGLVEVERVTPGPIGVGTEHVFVRRFAGRRLSSRNRYTHYVPGRYVAFEFPEGWARGRASYLVEDVGPALTRLWSRVELDVGGVVAPILARVLERDTRVDEAVLRSLLDAAARADLASGRTR